MPIQSKLRSWDLEHKRILLKADLNIPLIKNAIADDAKLQALKPTINHILSRNGICVIVTHIGRPEKPINTFSTRHLLPWFTQHNYDVAFIESPFEIAQTIKLAKPGTIFLCENIRFYKEEYENDTTFAKMLAKPFDYYVNDGFSSMHRTHASVVAVAHYFDKDHKTIGLYTQKELHAIDAIMQRVQKPFIAIVGGKKVQSKLTYIQKLLDTVNSLIFTPALCFTFFKALGFEVGTSFVDDACLSTCKNIIKKAREKKVKLIMPLDIIVSSSNNDMYSTVKYNAIPKGAYGITVGAKTIATLEQQITRAHTIVYTGSMGFLEKPDTLSSMHKLLTVVAKSPAQTLIAGGDTIAVVQKYKLQDNFTHISLGGGATLAYSANTTLPGLEAISK